MYVYNSTDLRLHLRHPVGTRSYALHKPVYLPGIAGGFNVNHDEGHQGEEQHHNQGQPVEYQYSLGI